MIDVPGKLAPYHKAIINRKIYRKLVKDCAVGSIKWGDKSLAAIKKSIRVSIRTQQKGRCYFCKRRIIIERKNAYEAIEHYLDKSKAHYRKWVFNPLNLTICCQGCNIQKSTRELGNSAIWSHAHRPPLAGNYRWIHPYFDDYFENIEIHPGPVYKVKAGAPKPIQAQNMIDDLKLSDLKELERRNFEVGQLAVRLNQLAHRCITSGRRSHLALKILEIQKEIIESNLF